MLKTLSLPAIFGKSHNRTTKSAKEISAARAHAIAKKSRTSTKVTDSSMLWISYGLIAMNAVLFVMYFVDVNTSATAGYEMKTIQNKIAQLTEDSKKINLKIAEQSSIISMQTDFSNYHFVPVSGASYIQTSQLSVR